MQSKYKKRIPLLFRNDILIFLTHVFYMHSQKYKPCTNIGIHKSIINYLWLFIYIHHNFLKISLLAYLETEFLDP